MPGQRTKQFTHSDHSQRWLLKAGGLTHEHTDKHKAPPPTPHVAFEGALVINLLKKTSAASFTADL